MSTVLERWVDDIPSQFRDSPNILGIISALSKQLDELEAVNADLIGKTDIDTAVGKQLDMLGSVVNISRQEAYQLVEVVGAEVLDDSIYRNVLRFKALKNNSDATYSDLMKGLYLLWGDYGADISYYENDNVVAYQGQTMQEPAQIHANIADIPSDAMDPTMIKPMVIRPGGVRLFFTSSFRDQIEVDDWERFTNLQITTENNHKYNGVWRYNADIQYHADGENYRNYDGIWKFDHVIQYGPYEQAEVDEVDAVLLNQAKTKMLQMRAFGSDGWKITHFAFGTGLVNGEQYIPTPDRTRLVNEVCRTEVVNRVWLSDSTLQFWGAIGESQAVNEYITEVGLVDSDGDLVCIKTFPKKLKQNGVQMVFKIDDIVDLG